MELEGVRRELAAFLRRGGVEAAVSWPRERRTGPEKPVVLVSLQELKCVPAGMQDYLGSELDEKTGQWTEIYGRKAELTFVLDITAPPAVGADACREVFSRVVRLLQAERPLGLWVREVTGGETALDGKEGLLKLSARVVCQGRLYGRSGETGEFLDFTLRGDMRA